MKKIIVIGCPGSGKSTFSKRLKEITNLPLYHLDMLYHYEDGSHITREEFKDKLRVIFKDDAWILDGNYQGTLEFRIRECDTIFLLDYPMEVCVKGAEDRVGIKKDDIPWFEETLNEEFKERIMRFSEECLPEIYELVDKYKEEKEIIIFKTRKEADDYLKELEKNYE